jgi:glycosyltransferase involved in cell wall biosynthesis
MKVAVVTRYFPSSAEPSQGRSAYQTLRVLARSADVHVFYPNAAYPAFLKPRSRTYDGLDPAFRPPDVNASYYNFPALPLISRPLNGWMAARALLPQVRAFLPDIILSFFLYPDGFAALKIGQALGVPVVTMSIGSDINRIGDAVSRRHTRTVLREADAVVTVSSDLREKAIALGASPTSTATILNGCDLEVFHPMDRLDAREKLKIDPSSEAIVYIGRMDLQKGLRELVAAAAALRPSRPRLEVYLVGSGPDRPMVEDAIRASDAAGYIHVCPACAFDVVATWMGAADLITLPSYMEGCPNVVLEALACGRPVVATRVGGIPEIMGDACGRLVPPRDPAALAQALAEVLNGRWDPAAISAHWSRSWSAPAAEFLALFDALCPGAGRKQNRR